jgi:hypothetical protein
VDGFYVLLSRLQARGGHWKILKNKNIQKKYVSLLKPIYPALNFMGKKFETKKPSGTLPFHAHDAPFLVS